MVKLKTYSLSESKVGESTANKDIFGVEAKEGLIHFVVHMYQLRGMRKTAKVKTRAEVSGGGRKPWKQKGTGRARAGTSSSPVWVGGGVTFGPQNVKRHLKVNKKVAQLGLKMALSLKVPETVVLKSADADFSKKIKKVADFVAIMKELQITNKKVLYVTKEKLSREGMLGNIDKLQVSSVHGLNVFDVMNAQSIVFEDSSLAQFEEIVSNG